MTRELLQQALDALEMECQRSGVITAIREYLAQKEPEPVAWAQNPKDNFWVWCMPDEPGAVALYASPAAPAPVVPEDIAAIIACLGDDASLLRSTSDDSEEIAQNMDDAADMLERLAAHPAVAEPLTETKRGIMVMEHLGPLALTGGTLSIYDAFLRGIDAAEQAHGITGGIQL